MRACWLKWVGRDWSISADYIWLNYSGANKAFDQGIEIGIENTIRALLDASVNEDKMITAIQKSWGLSREDSAQKIGSVKRKIALEGLEEYLLCKGKSKFAVNKFKQKYSVIIRLNHDESLISLWDKPGQLYEKLLD